jgi:predicted nucleic acid-binding protein
VAVIVDSSVWIDALLGETFGVIEEAMTAGTLYLAPLVIAELLSGELTPAQRESMFHLLQEYPLCDTPLRHWMGVGGLRRALRSRGVNVTIPDAHVAQLALELDAELVTRDAIFPRIAAYTPLRLAQLR